MNLSPRFLTLISCSTLLLSSPSIFATTSGRMENDTGKIYYHLSFPVEITEQSEQLELNANNKDLIFSNFVAGALYAHLLHEQFPQIQFNNEYITGSLLGQLLQENLQTSDYQASSDWINPDSNIRKMLLSPGQGGPYQINDYSKRLEDHIGLINFTVLQKSLGYSIADQDNGVQTSKSGPVALDNKYFGPIAAAYFQYNDFLRLQSINADAWGPSAKYFPQCMTNLQNTPDNMLDMILNAAYNAGPWADITKTYIELCANYNNPDYAEKIKHIDDVTLNDQQYQQAVGTHESAGSTFILYPRQIRFYLDELYNKSVNLKSDNSYSIEMTQLENIFSRSLTTLAYVNTQGEYDFIRNQDAEAAFETALNANHLVKTQSLNVTHADERKQLFNILETALANLAQALHITFSETTEQDHNH